MVDANDALTAAKERQQQVEAAAQAARESIASVDREVRDLTTRLSDLDVERRMALGYVDLEELRDLRDALDQRRRWADGHSVSANTALRVMEILAERRSIEPSQVDVLMSPLIDWAVGRGAEPPSIASGRRATIGLEVDL